MRIQLAGLLLRSEEILRFWPRLQKRHHALFVNQMIKAAPSLVCRRRQFSWPYRWSGFDSVKLDLNGTLVIYLLTKNIKKKVSAAAISGKCISIRPSYKWLDLSDFWLLLYNELKLVEKCNFCQIFFYYLLAFSNIKR